jgi:integrase
MLVTPAAPQTRNTYRDILAASFDYAVREGWLDANPLASVKRASKRHDHDRILRRDDFYDPDEINRLLHHAPSVFEEAFWLCGAHAGLRLPGEALGLRWGAVDFQTGVMRPYDNWVRNEMDTTKTSDSEAIPMTPRLTRALAQLRRRGYAIGEPDFVFVSELTRDSPVSERPLREAFKGCCPGGGAQADQDVQPAALVRHNAGTQRQRHQDGPGAHAPRPPEHDRTVHGLLAAAGPCGADRSGA